MQSHKNAKLTKNASFDPFTTRGGGGIFWIKIENLKPKKVVTWKAPWRPEGQQERVSMQALTPAFPLPFRQTTVGFERPTSRTRDERPNHWAVLAYLF